MIFIKSILVVLQLLCNITQTLSDSDFLTSMYIEFKATWGFKHQNDGASQAETTYFLCWG
jgi:hypothetical protein